LDAVLFQEVDDLHLDFRLINAKNQIELTDCLQIHVLELPKYVPAGDNRRIEDPIEQWAFFFRRASDLTAEELHASLPDEVFSEATGILEMIAKDPQQRSLYEERLKMQMDEQARLQAARAEGRAEGRTEGEARGRIRVLQQLLGLPEWTEEEFQGRSWEDLATMEAELQRRLRERG
jgi:predicted transposase/invertase (TIGR01784 family)